MDQPEPSAAAPFKVKLKLPPSATACEGPSLSDEELLPPGSGVETEDIPFVMCEWEGCHNAGFWEVEALNDHIAAAHIDTMPKNKLMCLWSQCKFKNKPQGSRFTLQTHMRSHTGEKSFICSKPECDKTFTREDARVKHMRTVHQEQVTTSRRAPASRKKKDGETPKRGAAKDEDDEDVDSEMGVNEEEHPPEEPEEDPPELLEWADRYPQYDISFLRYLYEMGKLGYQTVEREALLMEYKMVAAKEAELLADKEALLNEIWQQELGPDAEFLARPVDIANVPPLKWSLANRTSLPPATLQGGI